MGRHVRSKKGKIIGRCPKCKKPYLDIPRFMHSRSKSTHHVLPKRHFKGKGPRFCLCRACHDALERTIPRERQAVGFYLKAWFSFLKGSGTLYIKQRHDRREIIPIGSMKSRRCR